jgi:hypothetical protein
MRGQEPCADSPIANPQLFSDLSQAESVGLQLQNPVPVHDPHWATELLAILSRIPNPGTHPLPDQVTLQLSDGGHNGKKRLPQTNKPLSPRQESA